MLFFAKSLIRVYYLYTDKEVGLNSVRKKNWITLINASRIDGWNSKFVKCLIIFTLGLRSIEAALKLPKDLSQMNFTDEKEYQSIIEKLKK